jgi:hypothetical protein
LLARVRYPDVWAFDVQPLAQLGLGSPCRTRVGEGHGEDAHFARVVHAPYLDSLTTRRDTTSPLVRDGRLTFAGAYARGTLSEHLGGQIVQRLLQVVLTAWREADRVASERATESREHQAAVVAADRLRGLYADLVESAKADNDVAALEAVPSPEAL